MQDYPILLYDIDGTILNVHSDFIIEIIEEQLHHFGISKDNAKSRSFAGRTDRGIFMELIGDMPNGDSLFHEVMTNYAQAMTKKLSPNQMVVHDGAVESVHEAVSLNIPVGLCTGNIRTVAMKKVQEAGLQGIFSFGGFGEVSENRNDLPGEADREYKSQFNKEPLPGQYVIIGDTPNDIRCAKYFGAKSVAVTTGGFSEDELATHKPDLIVDSLHEPEKWLRRLNFSL
jgi:phosphoglycolate phosphatase-like HAD superfamily hydrolase